MKKHLILLISLFITVLPTLEGQKLEKQYDTMLSEVFTDDGPGCAAIVVKDDKVIYRKAMGMAELELGVKMIPEHIFRIGSITKQFTACAILKLAEEGKLSLDDDITTYIKDYPTHGHRISIEHLLTHTSGIKSYTGMQEWDGEMRKKDFTPGELIDFFKNQPMDFVPGEEFRYNNSGYFLLGFIIEVASGKSYGDYLHEAFFEPLGMANTSYDDPSRIIVNRASGYAKGEDAYINAAYLSMTQPYSAGALISTVDDLYTWYKAVFDLNVVNESSLKRAHSSFTLNNGKETGYGYGWALGNIQGSRMISHGGGINGFLTASVYLPEDKVFVALFSNCNCNPPGTLAHKMAALAIGKPFEWKEMVVPEEDLKSYEGVYESEFDGDRIIKFEDGKLFSMRTGGVNYRIIPYEPDKFYFKDNISELHFQRKEDGEIISVVSKSTQADILWMKTDRQIPLEEEIELDDEELDIYTGRYELTPQFFIKIFREEKQLYLQGTGQPSAPIFPSGDHKFFLKVVDAKIEFTLNDSGKVESLTLYQNGVHLAKKVE